jgi:hypothetical protein
MNLSFDRFKKIDTENSILNDTSTSDIQDTNSPYTLIEWVISSSLDLGNPEQYIEQYGTYLRAWASKNSTKLVDNKNLIAESYKKLLREITLNYTTNEEKRYLSNVDFDNPLDLDAVIPFYATRLKDIVIFLSKKRDDVKLQKTKFSLFGINEGVEKLTKKLILELTNTEEFILEFFETVPSLHEPSKHTFVQTEEFYDINDDYFDIDPCDDTNTKGIDYDPKIFFDFTAAIRTAAEDLGTVLQSISALDLFASSNEAISILSNSTDVDTDKFPISEFSEYIANEDSLNIINQKTLVNNLLGNNTAYISAGKSVTDIEGNTTVQFVSGIQAEPSNHLLNFFNKNYATINYKPNTSKGIYTKRQLGGFFTPQHLGTSSYVSVNPTLVIKSDLLDNNTIYEIPDPTIYSHNHYEFIEHIDNAMWIKADRSNDNASGDIVNSNKLQKLYNYQSSTETNKFSQYGVAKVEDNFDFWSGETGDIWNNRDVFQLKLENQYDLTTRQLSSLVNKGDLFKWQDDIYGNNFTLFKHTKPWVIPSLTKYRGECDNQSITTEESCRLLEAGGLLDTLTNSDVVYSLSADGSTLGSLPTIEEFAWGGLFSNSCSSFVDFFGSIITYTCQTIEGESGNENFESLNTTLTASSGTGFASTIISDTLWDGDYFGNNFCDPAIGADYVSTSIPFLSSSGLTIDQNTITSLQTYTSPISTKLSIYDQRNNTYGELWTRNANNSIISPVSSAINSIFDKYQSIHSGIQTELQTSLKDFDIIYDTLVLQTKNYIIFEKINYDYKTNEFKTSNVTNYISTSSTNTEKSIHYFFNEQTNKIYTGYTRTALYSTVSGVVIYPEIYEYDVNEFKLQKIFPAADDNLEEFRIGDSITSVSAVDWEDITSEWQDTITKWDDVASGSTTISSNVVYDYIDHPIITYNELNDRYYVITRGSLSATGALAQDNVFSITKSEFKLFNNKFEHINSNIYWPETLGYDQDIIKDESATVSIDGTTSTTISLGPVSAFNYELTINTSALSGAYKYVKVIYDFDDGSPIEVTNRPAAIDYSLATATNVDDISDPLQHNKTHTYFFTGSAASTQYAYVSAIDHLYNIKKYTISINRQPYTLASSFSALRLIECKSFLDDDYQEKTLLTLESADPNYIVNMALQGNQFNKTTFSY